MPSPSVEAQIGQLINQFIAGGMSQEEARQYYDDFIAVANAAEAGDTIAQQDLEQWGIIVRPSTAAIQQSIQWPSAEAMEHSPMMQRQAQRAETSTQRLAEVSGYPQGALYPGTPPQSYWFPNKEGTGVTLYQIQPGEPITSMMNGKLTVTGVGEDKWIKLDEAKLPATSRNLMLDLLEQRGTAAAGGMTEYQRAQLAQGQAELAQSQAEFAEQNRQWAMLQDYNARMNKWNARKDAVNAELNARTQLAPHMATIGQPGYMQYFGPGEPGAEFMGMPMKPSYVDINPMVQQLMQYASQMPTPAWGG